MIRLTLLHAIDAVKTIAAATVGACVVLRGLILDEPKPRRDPFTGRAEDRPN